MVGDDSLIEKLQKVQNSAAKLILRAKKFDHVTPLLRSLHWLPVPARINYKLACICFSVKFENGPEYLNKLLRIYENPSAFVHAMMIVNWTHLAVNQSHLVNVVSRRPMFGTLCPPTSVTLFPKNPSAIP